MEGRGADAGWEAVNAAVAAAQAQIATVAPDAETAIEGQAYVMRILSHSLNDAFLSHMMTDGGLGKALPTRGAPNPDYCMYHAGLDPTLRYRLEGAINASERVGIGTYSFGAGGSAIISDYASFEPDTTDSDGHFALDIASDADGPGGLKILPDSRALLIRVLHRDPAGASARLHLTGCPPVRNLTLAQGSVQGALGQVAQALTTSIGTFLEWTEVTSAAKNRFHTEDPEMTQGVLGDPDTRYFLGSYNLENDEWLEVTMPSGIPGYWSLHAYNHWCEWLPGAGIGDNTAVADECGLIRIAVGPSTWGDAANRIDTLGRKRGALVCRVIGANDVTVPQTVVHSNT